MTAPTLDTSTRAVAEHLLNTLRLLDQADDQRLAVQPGGAYGDVREALIKVLETQDWGRGMADEAILHAMLIGDTLFESMMASRAG
ncbi:hypothetical protein [Nonomuraea basaltis]|uniref:hypothetical protein n=1 Tax=Nonomuraea basaltis TaxID=2495887 RepID=UPI00110C508C|nr:hypothetical protein [Nonomuraea basaltis]TMR92809.1 hypothetical protein EJK15_42400 [Nonomuraea basaltis]